MWQTSASMMWLKDYALTPFVFLFFLQVCKRSQQPHQKPVWIHVACVWLLAIDFPVLLPCEIFASLLPETGLLASCFQCLHKITRFSHQLLSSYLLVNLLTALMCFTVKFWMWLFSFFRVFFSFFFQPYYTFMMEIPHVLFSFFLMKTVRRQKYVHEILSRNEWQIWVWAGSSSRGFIEKFWSSWIYSWVSSGGIIFREEMWPTFP